MKHDEVLSTLIRTVQESMEEGARLLEDTEFQERFKETAAVVIAVVRAEVLAALEPSIRRLIRLVEEERNPHAVIRAIELLMELGGLKERVTTEVNVNASSVALTSEDVERLRETVMQLEAYRRGPASASGSGPE